MTLQDYTNLSTIFAALAALYQLYIIRKQTTTTFEDAISQQYREIIARIDTRFLLGDEINDTELLDRLDEFYHYFDLCNEQAYLRNEGRIRVQTWTFWQDGINANLSKPAFKKAWQHISKKDPDVFSELKELLQSTQP